MKISMTDKELQTTLSGLIRILETLKDDEFVLSVPLADAQAAGAAEGGAADGEETI